MGERVEPLAARCGSRVGQYPHPAAAELNELSGRLPSVLDGLEAATLEEFGGLGNEVALSNRRADDRTVVQPPGQMAERRFEQVTRAQLGVDPATRVPPAEQQVSARRVHAGPVAG